MLSLAIYFGLCVLFTSIVVYSIGGIKESKIAISEQVDLICANMLENIWGLYRLLESGYIKNR